MKRIPAYFLFLLLSINTVNSQVPKKRLPQNINVPTYSHIFPSLSGDGNQMIYLTNYTNSDGFETRYTYKTGAEIWADPEPIPSINKPGLDHIGSFCLSHDGNFVVFSSRRSHGIGNYDIWISEKIGNNWSRPVNPGKPLNSQGHEGNPSLSADGKTMYFMRCESMGKTKKNNCRLFVSHKISATRWSEPEALPDYINTGHETTPRIQADNKTLVFASGRSGGKGMLDLYTSTLDRNTWSKPVPLSFLNTDQNDEFVTIPARGDIIYFSGSYRDNYNIFKAIIPEKFRPQKVLMLTGTVSYDDGQKPSEDIFIRAYDLSTGDVYATSKLKQNDDSFTIFLTEGTSYDISAFPQKGGYTYFSKIYDLNDMLIAHKEELPVSLSALKSGMSMALSNIRYDDYSSVLNSDSNIEIKRIKGFLQKNPDIRIEIGAFIDQVYTDSIPTNDLTEVIADTIFCELEKIDEFMLEYSIDSLQTLADFEEDRTDSMNQNLDTLYSEIDSMELENNEILAYNNDSTAIGFLDELDSAIITPKDSLLAVGFELFEEDDINEIYYKINYTYHNDRTQKQAEALMNKLIEAGVPSDLLEAKGYGDDWTEDRAEEERNYWIELKIFKR